MDLSFWTQLNPKIIYEPTRKMFFNKYVCRLVVDCPAARLVNSKQPDMHWLLRERIESTRYLNKGGSWRAALLNKDLEKAKVDQLENLRQIRIDYGDTIKFRIEEPNVGIYTETEEELRVVANRIDTEYQSNIQGVQFPENDIQLSLLKEGRIIMAPNSKIEYRYKVMFRDGTYSNEVKQQILNYIDGLEEDALLSKGTRAMLAKPYPYMWGTFAYFNDISALTFLNIICPNIVLKIHERTLAE